MPFYKTQRMSLSPSYPNLQETEHRGEKRKLLTSLFQMSLLLFLQMHSLMLCPLPLKTDKTPQL